MMKSVFVSLNNFWSNLLIFMKHGTTIMPLQTTTSGV
jgi:hypothetical protein